MSTGQEPHHLTASNSDNVNNIDADQSPFRPEVSSSTHNPIPETSVPQESPAVKTGVPSATNASQWFYKPCSQPSSISTTATSSLMPSMTPTDTVLMGCAAGPSSLAATPSPAISIAPPVTIATRVRAPVSIYSTSIQSALAAGSVVGPAPRLGRNDHTAASHPSRTSGPYSSQSSAPPGSFHLNPQPPLPIKDESIYHNPYRAPSNTSTWAFVPPRLAGYEFTGGSQAGNMGLMMGKRLSDGVPVTGKLHQSRVLLQHEYRILKRLQFSNARFFPDTNPPSQSSADNVMNEEGEGGMDIPTTESTIAGNTSSRECHLKPGKNKRLYETGCVETEKYFNRVVEDFIDMEQEDMSILVLDRLGPNLLSHTHHVFMGLEGVEGLNNIKAQEQKNFDSPFLDVRTFLIFALKTACILEALLQANLAHLAICPTTLHWMPAMADIGPWSSEEDSSRKYEDNGNDSAPCTSEPPRGPHVLHSMLRNMDINETKLRLFDFTHSKILSHERARAPNNIVEWQIPGYLEYHLQFLAPEQTGRAETWMDHRTDIYGLGATLFSLLTMQYPNPGKDSVQILQGVLSRDLPPLRTLRPDMPPVIDAILRKMTQKQPSRRYQNAFGFKQDILRCLNELHKTGRIDSFELGRHDLSYQFVLPNSIFGRLNEQQMISEAIAQAAGAYQQSLNGTTLDDNDDDDEEDDTMASRMAAAKDADHYIFEDDIVSLKSQISAKIPLSSKTLLRTPKPFDGQKSVHQGPEVTDPIVRVVFVSGPSGVGKTVLIRGLAAVARNSGLFAGGVFEVDRRAPYSAIMSCIQSALRQLLTKHTDALASLVVAIRTAFEPNSGISIICDLVPELKYFFGEYEMLEGKDVPLSRSVARFHALILKLIRVISTHFFMTWLIDDLQFADENSIDLLATLVNASKRLPVVFIIAHRDTPDCLLKVKHILTGRNSAGSQNLTGSGALRTVHHDQLMDDLSTKGSSSHKPKSKSSALRGTGLPLVVRGGGGVRFIRLQDPTLDTIQDFLGALLHREKADVVSLATALRQKSWLTIRQLVVELHRNQTIYFSCSAREWAWESCQETLMGTVRKLTGEEYAFLTSRFQELDWNTKKALVCASIFGPTFTIHDLQLLISATYPWTDGKSSKADLQSEMERDPNSNKGLSAMGGIQAAISEGILVYTSVPDLLRFHHGVMRRVAITLLEGKEEMEKLHFEMTKILISMPGQEFRTANHVIQCLDLIKKKLTAGTKISESSTSTTETPQADSQWMVEDSSRSVEVDASALCKILSLAGEKSQRSGAQDMALAYWNAAMTMLPENCWDQRPETLELVNDNGIENMGAGSAPHSTLSDGVQNLLSKQQLVYHEALKLHLQCIEAERWSENFDQAMKICEIVLSKVTDPIDRARVYEHQIEMSVWAYSLPDQASAITVQCLQELGISKDIVFNPSDEDMRTTFDEMHALLLKNLPHLEADQPKVCSDPKIAMMMEVLSIASSSLYYCNVPFMASALIQSIKLTCEHGITKDTGRALVSFALTYSTWFGCLDHVYELGRLACAVSNDNHHVKLIFYLAVQHWGDHVANSIPALEETLAAVDLTCDRLFHTAGMIHVSVMKVLVGRVHLNDLMGTTIELLARHIEFGPKSHGIEVMQGILQMIKCLKGRTLASNPETIFEDVDFSENKSHSRKDRRSVAMVHNNSTYKMLKVVAAFIFGHYAFIQEVTDAWHDDPSSIMNFEGSWIAHCVFTVVGLALVNLLGTEMDPEIRGKHKRRLFKILRKMELMAQKYPTNHAAMYYLLKAEIVDQGLIPDDSTGNPGVATADGSVDMKKALLLYEKAIKYSVDGDFPLHECFSYELTAKCHLRHGLVTTARYLMANAFKVYQNWGAKGKVQWYYRTYPDLFPSPPEVEPTTLKRSLFYKPNDNHGYTASCSLSSSAMSSNGVGVASSTSPWTTNSPKVMCSPSTFGMDAVSAAAAAMAESNLASSFRNGYPSATSTSSSTFSAPLYSLQNTWLNSPQSPEADNADLDVLDFSSVIEAMQVIASEIDLDLLLVKSLGVLNQSVGANQCCVIISKDQELVLAASLGNMGRCESVNPPMEVGKCGSLFHGIINYVVHTSTPCLLTNAKDDPRFCADTYLKQRTDLKTVLCAPILHKATLVGVLYMEDFPERAFANKRLLVMNLLVQQLGISITNALLYQSVLQSETKLNELLENMPCGIALWDAAAKDCQYINSSWKDMTGFTVDEIMSSRWMVLVHPEEIVEHRITWNECVQAGVPCQWECRYRLKDDTYRWAIIRMLPIMASREANKILQWLTVTIDIDDQRRAVQLKSNFLANMSHELRTPFSGILGMLSLLRDSSGLSHEQFEFVDMAKASCEMLIRIVDDLLNFSKLEADKVTLEYIPLCFEEILGDVCDLLVPLASKKGLELIILVDDTLPVQLIGDPDRMKQILMNLIGNAIKFSTSGNVVIKYWHELRKRDTIKPKMPLHSVLGILTGKCKLDPFKGEVDVDESRLGDEVILHCSVTDQGIGLTPDEQKMLFVSFQQTDNGTTRKYGGTGLGLSICAQLIMHMHGRVTVESEKGKGSTFTFSAKVRTMTEYDQEQNMAESERILECERVMAARLAALENKRVLILSPNKLLREQLMKTAKAPNCMEFDDVASAVQCGAIGVLGGPFCCSSKKDRGVTVVEAGADQIEGIIGVDGHVGPTSRPALEGILPFDFILVDHVLDSAELDCIYPSPVVAFVLLLAPTTETLRWILPPAKKPVDEESDETDSGEVEVGGERIRQASKVDFTEKARGQVRSVSYLSKIKTQSGLKQPDSTRPLKWVASKLFKRKKALAQPVVIKKRKRRDSIELIDVSMPSGIGGGDAPMPSTSTTNSPFQICRMIKPVRRLKLLLIMCNALLHHEQILRGESTLETGQLVEISEESGWADSDGGVEGENHDQAAQGQERSPLSSCVDSVTSSRSVSPARYISPRRSTLKRRQSILDAVKAGHRDDSSSDGSGNGQPVHKVAKIDAHSSSSSSSSKSRAGRATNSNLPRRARNNDALILLLTHEERKRCNGVNVLVAEDDFVSQKILEKQLSKLGMNVVIANNGQEAVDRWLEVERGYYTIAIFDHHMPIMDGLAATKKLRDLEAKFAEELIKKNPEEYADAQKHVRIPIVGLSADIQLSTKEKCIEAGMDEYMTKPLLTQGLALLIKRYCCG